MFAILSIVRSLFQFFFSFSLAAAATTAGVLSPSCCEGPDHFNENPPRLAPHGALGSSLPPKALVVGVALAAGGLFGLFQLQLLPKSWGPWVSKMYFWPTLPFTMIRAFDNYWTKMDGKPVYIHQQQYSYTAAAGAAQTTDNGGQETITFRD